jgi:hypothetical protein
MRAWLRPIRRRARPRRRDLPRPAPLRRQGLPNLVYFNEVDKGGHNAAWEEPQLFAEELRSAFRTLR